MASRLLCYPNNGPTSHCQTRLAPDFFVSKVANVPNIKELIKVF